MKAILSTIAVLSLVLLVPAAHAVNSLAVTGAAALNGSAFGLAVTSDQSSNDVYVASTHANDETTYNFSFYIFPGTLPDDTVVDDYAVGYVKDSIGGDDPDTKWFIPIFLRRQNTFWTLQTNIREDDDTFPGWLNSVKICGDAGTSIPCSSFTSGVMFEFRFSAGTGADGSLQVYKNGALKQEWTGLDLNNRAVTEIRWGAIFQGDAANRSHAPGTYYFDEFVSTR